MERKFETEVEVIKNMILSMGAHVEKALEAAIGALTNRNPDLFSTVHEIEALINQEHMKIDEACINFLAIQGPKARDLRLIFSIVKINADLERMGDQCVNISYTGKDFLSRGIVSSMDVINEMTVIVRKMVKDSLDSFVREDAVLAREVLLMDDGVDSRKGRVFQELSLEIKKNPSLTEGYLDLILIARNLERLGDHATNIAEDVIFVSTGKDIRHGGNHS